MTENDPNNFFFLVEPGNTVKVTVTFDAQWESSINIRLDGAFQKGFSNYFGGAGEWITPVNASDDFVGYFVEAFHKLSPPDASQPWLPSEKKITLLSSAEFVVGFDNGEAAGEPDYNDAVVRLTAISSPPPIRDPFHDPHHIPDPA